VTDAPRISWDEMHYFRNRAQEALKAAGFDLRPLDWAEASRTREGASSLGYVRIVRGYHNRTTLSGADLTSEPLAVFVAEFPELGIVVHDERLCDPGSFYGRPVTLDVIAADSSI
jgi:hypothetical protein